VSLKDLTRIGKVTSKICYARVCWQSDNPRWSSLLCNLLYQIAWLFMVQNSNLLYIMCFTGRLCREDGWCVGEACWRNTHILETAARMYVAVNFCYHPFYDTLDFDVMVSSWGVMECCAIYFCVWIINSKLQGYYT